MSGCDCAIYEDCAQCRQDLIDYKGQGVPINPTQICSLYTAGIPCHCVICRNRQDVETMTRHVEERVEGEFKNTETAGGTRYTEGKIGGFWMLPLAGLKYVAEVATFGAEKYAPFDWARGQSFSNCLNSAWRHLIAAMVFGIYRRDRESRALHLAACVWNLLCILHFIAVSTDEVSEHDDIDPIWFKTASEIHETQAEEGTGSTYSATGRDSGGVDSNDPH